MHRLAALAVLAFAPLLPAQVRVWQAPLTIPTYELDQPDPNPALPGAARTPRRPVYPYPVLDAYTTHKVDRAWNAVYLENEYLRVIVLPELGGKLYAIFDKTTGRDALYTNHVVKYANVAIRGAWISGGIEWNFPDGHTATTVSPVDYVIRSEPGGAASVTVGDTERVQRMQWAVTIRLRPGWKVVETETRLNNRRDLPGRYWYWATAAAPARDDMRFVYPMREAYPHAFWPVYSFPVNNGVDVSRYPNVKSALSLFARQSKRDFLGVYYERDDHGVIHVADHRLVPGKKTWTWGSGPAGRVWIGILTDADGQYVEFQAGRFETQMEHEHIAPHQVDHFTHFWYPVDKLGGGFVEATRDAALNAVREGAKLRVSLNVNTKQAGAVLKIGTPDKTLHTAKADLSPAKPYSATFDVPEAGPLTIALASANGRQLLSYRTDAPVDGNPEFRPATKPPDEPKVPQTAAQAWERGVKADRESRDIQARNFWETALKLDARHAPSLVSLGISYLRTGEFERAANYLTRAAAEDAHGWDARYYLALVRRAQGKPAEAMSHLEACLSAGHSPALVRYALGETALASGDAAKAVTHLTEAVRLQPEDIKAATVLGVALRVAGRTGDARKRISSVLAAMPIDYLALSEASRLGDTRSGAELKRLLARERDSALELAFDYLALGRRDEAAEVLAGSPYAMARYTLGYIHGLRGDAARAKTEYAAGAAADRAYVFPHRLEEIRVLEAAVKANPSDARAHYYLGNALASKHRRAEAVAAWREAVRLEPSNATAWRNLGVYLSVNSETRAEGVAAYRRSIEADPSNYRAYVALMTALENDLPGRLAVFEKAPDSVRRRGAAALAFASACAEAEQFEQAAALLDAAEITPAEGDNRPLRLYRRIHTALIEKYRKAGREADAAAEERKLANPPRGLSVGMSEN